MQDEDDDFFWKFVADKRTTIIIIEMRGPIYIHVCLHVLTSVNIYVDGADKQAIYIIMYY